MDFQGYISNPFQFQKLSELYLKFEISEENLIGANLFKCCL